VACTVARSTASLHDVCWASAGVLARGGISAAPHRAVFFHGVLQWPLRIACMTRAPQHIRRTARIIGAAALAPHKHITPLSAQQTYMLYNVLCVLHTVFLPDSSVLYRNIYGAPVYHLRAQIIKKWIIVQ